jgi:copper(I)-binding protein
MRTLMLAAAAALAATCVQAAPTRSGGLEIAQPWSRPAVAGTNAVGYMVVANRGRAADALVGAESPLARRVEMHRSGMAGGIMSMQKQARVAVPAGGSVTFGPGAYHLMLIGIARTLKPGDQVPVTLTFASGARLNATLAVGAGPPATAHMGHMGG